MIFTWTQVVSFLAAMLFVGWLIYPSAYFRGQMHRAEGDRSDSIAFLRGYLHGSPGHKGAAEALAAAYEAAGRAAEAVEVLERFYRRRRGDSEAGMKALRLMQQCDMTKRAAAFRWEFFRDLNARAVPDRRLLEELMYQAFQEAAAAQDDAGVVRALTALSRVASQGESYSGEILRLFMARRDLKAVAKLLQQQVARAPREVETRRTLVRVYRLARDPQAALQEIQAGLEAVPQNPRLLADRVAVLLSQGRCDLAIPELRRLAGLEPRDPSFPKELGRCLIEAGRLEEGMKVYRDFLERDPSDKERWWSVVYAYADRLRHAEAAEWLERFLKRFPEDEGVLDMLVYQYEAMEEPQRAVAALRRRLEAHPRDLKRLTTLAGILSREERFDEAARVYERLVAESPEDRGLWSDLAYVHESSRDFRAAAAVLERCLKRHPDDAKAKDRLVSAYLALGERKRAIELLQSHFGAPPRTGAPGPMEEGQAVRKGSTTSRTVPGGPIPPGAPRKRPPDSAAPDHAR